jgi:hypothetical protein
MKVARELAEIIPRQPGFAVVWAAFLNPQQILNRREQRQQRGPSGYPRSLTLAECAKAGLAGLPNNNCAKRAAKESHDRTSNSNLGHFAGHCPKNILAQSI